MMLNNKKSSGKSWLKLLAFLPIVATVMALNAETVNDYVYQQPKKKLVKKGRKDGKVVVGGKTIEVKTDTETTAPLSVRIVDEKKDNSNEPLVIIDGERASMDELRALAPKTIDHINVLKDKASLEVYGEDGKNGVIDITTKNAVKSSQNQTENLSYSATLNYDTSDADDNESKDVEINYSDVFDVAEQMPEFPGGVNALMAFLAENIRYPEAAIKAGVHGRVVISFIIEPDGRISNAHVLQKVNDDLDAEAIRVIGSMPKWNPGKQDGKAVRVKYALPITFRLN